MIPYPRFKEGGRVYVGHNGKMYVEEDGLMVEAAADILHHWKRLLGITLALSALAGFAGAGFFYATNDPRVDQIIERKTITTKRQIVERKIVTPAADNPASCLRGQAAKVMRMRLHRYSQATKDEPYAYSHATTISFMDPKTDELFTCEYGGEGLFYTLAPKDVVRLEGGKRL